MQTGTTKKLVSVIVPAYKCERYIKACLDSVLEQTYKPLEVIVVYDPSPDNTLSVLGNYRKNVILVTQKRKTNPALARNVGLNLAMGDYIAFCDADDYFEKTKIEKQVKVLEKSRVDITYTDIIFINEENEVIERRLCPEIIRQTIGSWIASPFTAFSSFLIKKELINHSGGFDPALGFAEDTDFLLRLFALCKVQKTNGFLTYYRVRTDSLSSRPRIWKDLQRIKVYAKNRLGKYLLLEVLKAFLPDLIIGVMRRPKEVSFSFLSLFGTERKEEETVC